MEMRHLRYFVTLADEKNFRRAAERLGMAQPPLSRQIRALETEVGCRLVTRTSRGVQLTPAGRAFLEQARVTLACAQRAIDRARGEAPDGADRLALAFEPIAGMAIVQRALARFAHHHPSTVVELHERSAAEACRAVREGLTQAAVIAVSAGTAIDGLVVDRIATVPLCLAVATGHPLAGPRPVSWRRLAGVPFVSFAREAAPVLHDAAAAAFLAEGVELVPRHRATDVTAALMLVAAGLGITVMPAGWQPPHFFGVACRPLRSPVASIEFAAVHREGGPGAAVARLLVAARAVSASDAVAARARRTPALRPDRQLA
jgi:DNA-binding transcriptional LysR family regulator